MRVLITGANGFIGRQLAQVLQSEHEKVVCCSRKADDAPNFVICPSLSGTADWASLLQQIDVVIHLAGKAHNLYESKKVAARGFRQANVDGTLRLAQQALAANVKRFIFISSVGVNGLSSAGEAFSESSPAAPHADYAKSKYEAEQGLEKLTSGTSMELVVIRPPLVYAAHAPGNFKRLLKLVSSGCPLPFASISNRRSMIALENLADFIKLCVTHPQAANNLFLISDGSDLSIGEIVSLLATGMNKKARLFAMPAVCLLFGALLIGRKSTYTQLCGSLLVDSSKSRSFLNWVPVISSQQALLKAGQQFIML
ncbi:NAD-dependent epimerase/dehydratase family protein [Pseudomonas sp. Z5-35]|uniref:NAD-dependent epimerase/dehydratase family protein n=1 Tax=unclassified Pseudomonas TaxID=196821 RepID=UPI003DA7AA05